MADDDAPLLATTLGTRDECLAEIARLSQELRATKQAAAAARQSKSANDGEARRARKRTGGALSSRTLRNLRHDLETFLRQRYATVDLARQVRWGGTHCATPTVPVVPVARGRPWASTLPVR